jgi:D-alanyl-lipoteichoic acid acyltransferase DltB (MBOAT superfamily)
LLFPTVQFAIFFPVVLALNWVLMPRPWFWKPFIVVASYAFYAAANWRFCFLLGGITLWNQAAARLVQRTGDERPRRWIVGVAVAGNLLVLAIFKYYSFFVQDVDRVLDAMRLGLPLPLLTIALPVGVSFFTFQAISYTVDVHRRLIEPASLLDAAIYLSFFPHLVAGPIVRAREFLPQLAAPRDPQRVAVGAGVSLIALGLIKKVVIADYLARAVVDPVFAVPQSYAAPDAALAAYAYTAQIYCDFSGYTDIAIGLALLMGFVFPQNFDRPYRSLGVREFWRRWHMTLSRFLRDFLYIPLGGNRGRRWFVYRNLMITMVLGGLWHGAAWTFVLWGALHGLALCLEHAFGERWARVPKWVRWSVTFNYVVVAWIFFRSQSIGDAWTFLGRLFTPGPATLWAFTPVALAVAVVGFQLLPPRPLEGLRLRFERLNPVVLATALAVVILFAGATVPSQGVAPFIYFRF